MGKNGREVANIRVELKVGDQHLEATTDSDGAAVFPDAKGARAVSFEVRVYSVRAGPFEVSPSDRASARKGSAFQQLVSAAPLQSVRPSWVGPSSVAASCSSWAAALPRG